MNDGKMVPLNHGPHLRPRPRRPSPRRVRLPAGLADPRNAGPSQARSLSGRISRRRRHRDDDRGSLFRTTRGRTGALTGEPMYRIDAYRMIRRRAAEAGFKQKLGCHVFRATGITAYLEAGGTLENAQAMAAHES